MHRLISLMIVLAHLGAASIPCVEMQTSVAAPAVIGGQMTHAMPAMPAPPAPPVEEYEESAEAVGHMSISMAMAMAMAMPANANADHTHAHSPEPAPVAHAGHNGHDAHEGHASHNAMAAAPEQTVTKSRAPLAQLELRAPCLCGCSQRSNSPGTSTPQPPTFAPAPIDPPRLVVAIPAIDEATPPAWPASPLDTPDPIPIAS